MGWVIRNKETKEAVLEVFDERKLKYLNTIKYEAVPILRHLQELNTGNTDLAADQSPQGDIGSLPLVSQEDGS